MPKSNPSASPTNHHSQPKSSLDDSTTSRTSDVALRKKKNADAQAAFRARRANYIATLEETVTSLESVVLQLQESCRDSRTETQELRQENSRLRHEFREREKYWRALWQSRKSGQGPGSDDTPPLPPPSTLSLLQTNGVNPHVGSSQLHHYQDENIGYRNDDSCPAPFNNTNSYSTSPSMSFSEAEQSLAPDEAASQGLNNRLPKYNPYAFSLHGSPRNGRWQMQPISHAGTSGPESGNQSSQSPVYVDSPTLTTSEMSFSGRFSGDEQKVALHSVLENAPYAFPNDDRFIHKIDDSLPNSRSMSPSSTPGSSSSTSLTSPFQFTFPDAATGGPDRREFDFRRHSLPHGEVTLHGGTADISSSSLTPDAVRYRLASRKSDSLSDRIPPIPGLPPLAVTENSSSHEHAPDDCDPTHLTSKPRRRRGTIPSHSRSPSPGPATMSCTVAVIKAQAFGALRRTRARAKKPSDGAARVAMGVLEARGIGIGGSTSSKRPRVDSNSVPMET